MLNTVRTGIFLSVMLVAMLIVTPASAHHSFPGTFTDEIIVVEGVVERLKFSNPHVIVYFSVTNESGEQTQWLPEPSLVPPTVVSKGSELAPPPA